MANKFNVGDKVKLSATYYSNPDYYFGPDWRDVTFTVLTTTAIDSITLKRDGFEMDPKWHFSAGHFELVKDEAPFKIGDKVRRIKRDHAGMKVGDVGVVERLTKNTFGVWLIKLEGKRVYHATTNLELVKDEAPFKIGDKVRRLKHGNVGMKVGDVGVVERLTKSQYGSPAWLIKLEGKVGLHNATNLELVKDEVAPAVPEHGVGEYILIVMRNGKLAPSIAPKVYSSWAQAKAVSHQMAANNPGEQFVIFKKIAEAVGEKPITPKVELKLVA